MDRALTHDVFRTAHKVARRGTDGTYTQRFRDAVRLFYQRVYASAVAPVAVRAIARCEPQRIDRSEGLMVGRIDVRRGQARAFVHNPMTDETYVATLTFAKGRGGFHCTCPDHQYRAKQVGPCKHAAALAQAVLNRKDED